MEEAPHRLAPAQVRVGHQGLHIPDDPRLLQVERLDDQVLLRREKGIEEAPGDADPFVHLLHRRVLDTLPGHQFQPHLDELGPDALPVRLGIRDSRHIITS